MVHLSESTLSSARALDDLISDFLGRRPPRIWSLIISLFGDAVMPYGGEIWVGSIIEVMASMRVDERAVRTALSRLVGDGWLNNHRVGRKSYYRLADKGVTDFRRAERRIYALTSSGWEGVWQIAVILETAGDRSDLRGRLANLGFISLTGDCYIRLKNVDTDIGNIDPMILLFETETNGDYAAHIARQVWDFDDLSCQYQVFCSRFSQFLPGTANDLLLTPMQSLCARTLLIQEYRRIALRDPDLPNSLLPAGWAGHQAQNLTGELYGMFSASADKILPALVADRNCEPGTAEASYQLRFSANFI